MPPGVHGSGNLEFMSSEQSARQKIRFLNGRYDTRLTKEWSMPVRIGEHVPSLTGYVGEKMYVDLVSMSV